MNYEKAYKEALERAKQVHKYSSDIAEIKRMEEIFPELKESEDEKIKEDLIQWINEFPDTIWRGHYKKDVIAWLEKQGEQKVSVVDFKAKDWYVSKVDGKIRNIYHSVDNLEPKFKVGDWAVWQDKYYKVNYNGCGYELVDQNDFSTSLEYGTVDENAHVFNIQDAKDGDVLAGKIDGDDYILIFKQIKDGWIETYGHYYDAVDRFCVPSQLFCRDYQGTLTPATKEQRKLLFSKMKEEGYEWDSDKKELKKIKQKPAWSEEDEEMLESVMATCRLYGHDNEQDSWAKEQINWLNHLKKE